MKTKIYKICGRKKTLDNFSKRISNLDGLSYECKDCYNKKQREYNKSKKKDIKKQIFNPDETIEKETNEVKDVYEGITMGLNRLINISKELLRSVNK